LVHHEGSPRVAKGKQVKGSEPAVRRRLSPRVERERKIQRIVTAIGVFAIIFAVVVVGIGWYFAEYRPTHQIVMKVNGVPIDMLYYIETLKSYGVSDAVPIVEQAELLRQAADKLGVTVTDA